MSFESIIFIALLIVFLFIFLFTFTLTIFTFFRWHKAAACYTPSIKLEEYACPKCGSKELELLGRRTIKCKKCGTTFTLGVETAEERWVIWPFFWWLPLIWPIPVRKE
jgi:DNA-directed RNA polymerase subunit RPC12/RpoP